MEIIIAATSVCWGEDRLRNISVKYLKVLILSECPANVNYIIVVVVVVVFIPTAFCKTWTGTQTP